MDQIEIIDIFEEGSRNANLDRAFLFFLLPDAFEFAGALCYEG